MSASARRIDFEITVLQVCIDMSICRYVDMWGGVVWCGVVYRTFLCTVLCAVLCTVLYCTVLYCTVLYCTAYPLHLFYLSIEVPTVCLFHKLNVCNFVLGNAESSLCDATAIKSSVPNSIAATAHNSTGYSSGVGVGIVATRDVIEHEESSMIMRLFNNSDVQRLQDQLRSRYCPSRILSIAL